MKIIGESNTGFIIDITEKDLEKLTGYYQKGVTFSIGKELKVGEIFSQLKELNRQEEYIKRVVHTLKTAAGMLDKINPIF